MTATVKEWNRYQATKALLRQEQQNMLTVIEGYMKREEPGCTLGGSARTFAMKRRRKSGS